jgi:hypothetical protein
MDMRQKDTLSLDQRINKNIHIDDNGCLMWTKPTKRRPRIMINNYDLTMPAIYVHRFLYHKHYGTTPKELTNICDNKISCVNPEHMQPSRQKLERPKEKTQGKKRHYQTHDDNCGGVDLVTVDRIMQAGTIEALPFNHVICNCERAYIATYCDGAYGILNCSNITFTKLRQLGNELWATV